jgi:hypothetical protein
MQLTSGHVDHDGTPSKFLEISGPEPGTTLHLVWPLQPGVVAATVGGGTGIPATLTIGNRPRPAVISGAEIVGDEASDEPLLLPEDLDILQKLHDLTKTIFAPFEPVKNPIEWHLGATSDDEGFISTVGDAVSAGAGAGALIGAGVGLFGGPVTVVVGATDGAALGAAAGFVVGVIEYATQ